MKRYLHNLANHPGLGYASMFTLMGAIAGFQKAGTMQSTLVGALIMSVFWFPVLVTSR